MVRATGAVSTANLPAWARVVHKGQPADALLKRLKTLRHELTKAEQDEIPSKVLDQIRLQLTQDDIMFHKSKDVRTTLACCQAELLRLYAPDCPYSDDELSTMFSFFLAVLTSSAGGLGKPSGTAFTDCVSLLSSLVATRAFALLCDRGISDKAIIDYFKKFFDLIKPETPKNVEIMLSEALSIFVQYSNVVPNKVVEILIANFHPKVKRTNPAAAHLAELIGNSAADELQTSVAQYFADVILQAAQTMDEEERESNLHAAHLLITQIHKSAPMLLFNVIPQVEEEMRAEDVKLRLIAVRTLGYIFADRLQLAGAGQIVMAKKYQSTWKVWLGRSWDKSSAVRIAWAESIKGLISHGTEVNAELMSYVEKKLVDPDEKVRSAMIRNFASLEYAALRSLIPRTVLQTLGERMKDKKHNIRIDALDALGRAFSLAFPDIQGGDSAALKQFSWIPSAMTEGLFAGDAKGMFVAVQAAFEQHILPLPKAVDQTSPEDWTSRLILVLGLLEEESTSAFVRLCNLQGPRGHLYAFIDACKRFNGGIVESSQADAIRRTLLRHIGLLAEHFADPLKAGQDLHAFAKQNDARTYKLIMTIMDPNTDLKTAVKVRAELDKRLDSTRSAATMLAFVRLSSFPFVSTDSVPGLLASLELNDDAQKDQSPTCAAKTRTFNLLKCMAGERSELLMRHIDPIKQRLHEEGTVPDLRTACLMALAKVEANSVETDATKLSEDDVTRLTQIIQSGTPSEAKWSAKLLSLVASNVSTSSYAASFHAVEQLCASAADDLLSVNSGKVVGTLAALRQIAKHSRDAMADYGDSIVETVLDGVLMQSYSAREGTDVEEDWFEEGEVDTELQARLDSLRLLADRCISYADHDEIEEIAKPALRLLVTCLIKGEPASDLYASRAAKAHIRLEAALQILKLARKPSCERLMGVSDYQLLPRILQDQVYNVRRAILCKLMKYALRRSAHLPARFYVLPFMVAWDPEEDLKNIVRESCIKLLAVMKPEMRLRYFDIGLARLIHLINHNQDFKVIVDEQGFSLEALDEAARYIDFYLDCCAARDNLSCLHHIAHRCKGMRDIFDEGAATSSGDGIATQGIHTLSDLSMCLIRRRADAYGTTLSDWQGSVGLPRDLYVPYASREEQAKVYKRSYLSNEAIELYQQPVRRERAGTAKRKPLALFEEQQKPKRAKTDGRSDTKASKGSRHQRRKSSTDLDGEQSVDEDEDEDAEQDKTDDSVISEDESVEPSEDEETAGRGVRTRRRVRQEKRMRNEGRRQRREVQALKERSA